MVTGQELPRTQLTNVGVLYGGQKPGCPNCGDEIVSYGNYPWKADFWNAPWKLQCPNCGEVYPKNDFHAFYRTALDEHGIFRRDLGDRVRVLVDHTKSRRAKTADASTRSATQ